MKQQDVSAGWRNRIVGEATVAASDLVAHPQNWRKHSREQGGALAKTLAGVGWVQRVIVNARTGRMLDGHLRAELARLQGERTPVPVVYVDLSEDEERAVLATLDPIASMAVADEEILVDLVRSIEDVDLRSVAGEVAQVLNVTVDGDTAARDAEPQIDRAEELRAKWGVEFGQLWQLGEHRLICGDCTDAPTVARVLNGDAPRLMVTDPPYGVNYDANWRNEAAEKGLLSFGPRRTGVVQNDDRVDWVDAYNLFPGDVAYTWSPGYHVILTGMALQHAGFQIRNQIIWVKPHFPISRGHYTYQHEPCWYGVRKGRQAHWIGDKNASTTWKIALDKNIDGGHSTQKPLACMATPISNHRGDVYEPFLGSGTTLIACENLKRRCYALEIHPPYVAVALERWSTVTGETPVLIGQA